MLFNSLALMGLVLGAQAGAVDLTAKNFDAEVLESGKSAFVKFLAPWCVPNTRLPSRTGNADRPAASFARARQHRGGSDFLETFFRSDFRRERRRFPNLCFKLAAQFASPSGSTTERVSPP